MAFNDNVVCLDNFSSGRFSDIAGQDIRKFEIIDGDVETFDFDDVGFIPDVIYHLACVAAPKFHIENPMKVVSTNIIGTMRLLEWASKFPRVKVIYASSSEIYGESVEALSEDFMGYLNPLSDRSCYRESKRVAESICATYTRAPYNMDISIVRFFNVYGYHSNQDGRVVLEFISRALGGKDIEVHGDGESIRTFCYVDDVIHALIRLLPVSHSGAINIGSPEICNISELARMIVSITDSGSRIVSVPYPSDVIKHRVPNIEMMKSKLGINKYTPLIDGIRSVVSDVQHYGQTLSR